MRPAKVKLPEPSEDDIQIAIAQFLDAQGICFCHVPNEGRHKVQYYVKQKKKGVKKGISDLLIFDRPPSAPWYVGAAIELKTKGGDASEEQLAWLEKLEQRGWFTQVCHGEDHALRTLEQLGYKGVG
jgi:hypothetical protein